KQVNQVFVTGLLGVLGVFQFAVSIEFRFDNHLERLIQSQLALFLQLVGIGGEILHRLLIDLVLLGKVEIVLRGCLFEFSLRLVSGQRRTAGWTWTGLRNRRRR